MKNLPLFLFGIVLINYLPMIFLNTFTQEAVAVSNFCTLIVYLIELVIIVSFFGVNYFKGNKKIEFNKEIKTNLILLIITTAFLLIVQLYNFIIKDFAFMDILNIGSVCINIFIFYICMINIKIDENHIFKFFKCIVYFSLIACMINLILYRENIMGIFGIGKYNRALMIKSFFINRNQFAFILYLAIISNMFVLKSDKKIIYKITLAIFLFSLFTTMSRTGVALGLLLVLLLNNFKLKTKIISLAILAVVVISSIFIVYNYAPTVWEKVNNTILRSNELKTLSGRTRIWGNGIEVLKAKPQNVLIGVGRFKSMSALENVNGRTFSQFHNTYLDTLIMGGIVEFIYIGFIYFSVIRKIYKSDLEDKYKKIYKTMFLTYAIYIALESFGRFSIGASDTICLIFFITIPILHANSIKNKEQEKK